MVQRNKFIQVRVTEEEHKNIFDGAHEISLPPATFVRHIVLEKVKKILKEDNSI